MSDKPYQVTCKGNKSFDAEEFYPADEGIMRFVISTAVDKEGEVLEHVKYIPVHNILSIDGVEVGEPEEPEEEDSLEMSKED